MTDELKLPLILKEVGKGRRAAMLRGDDPLPGTCRPVAIRPVKVRAKCFRARDGAEHVRNFHIDPDGLVIE